jgi:hypothetical protein
MAKVCIGILDGFIGKVGTVVGSFWKGLPVMRAYKRLVSDRNSEAQKLVRTRFGAINKLAGACLTAIRIGLQELAMRKRITETDVFVQENWERVQASAPGTVVIDYTTLVIADGNLPEASFGAPSFAEPLEVNVTMSDTSDIIGADSHDIVHLFVYCPDASAGIMGESVTRSDETIKAMVPAYWNGMQVHVYGFAVGDGPKNKGQISKSRYLGSGTIS